MLRRFWRSTFFQPFLDGDGGTGSGGAGAGDGTGGSGDGGGQAGQGGKEGQPFATFPDEASFNARIKREGKAQLDNLAKSMGFESADAMQVAAKSKKESDDAAKSDLEKEKARADKAEADGKTALDQANQRVINSEIKVFAAQAGFVDPADAQALVDRTGIQVDEQGNVKGAKEAVEALAKSKPHLVGTGKPPAGPGSAGNGGRQTGKGEEGTELATKLGQKQAETTKGQSENPYFK